MTTLVEHVPSMGDHHTNGPAIGPDGRLYFGQGTATNSGVVPAFPKEQITDEQLADIVNYIVVLRHHYQ